MLTVTNAVFIQMIEENRLAWPPFEVGGYIYSRAQGGTELYRTVTPA